LRIFHFLSLILVLTVIVGLLASFGNQTAVKNHCFTGIIQEKSPNVLLSNSSH